MLLRFVRSPPPHQRECGSAQAHTTGNSSLALNLRVCGVWQAPLLRVVVYCPAPYELEHATLRWDTCGGFVHQRASGALRVRGQHNTTQQNIILQITFLYHSTAQHWQGGLARSNCGGSVASTHKHTRTRRRVITSRQPRLESTPGDREAQLASLAMHTRANVTCMLRQDTHI